jgi:hypothetical protein
MQPELLHTASRALLPATGVTRRALTVAGGSAADEVGAA